MEWIQTRPLVFWRCQFRISVRTPAILPDVYNRIPHHILTIILNEATNQRRPHYVMKMYPVRPKCLLDLKFSQYTKRYTQMLDIFDIQKYSSSAQTCIRKLPWGSTARENHEQSDSHTTEVVVYLLRHSAATIKWTVVLLFPLVHNINTLKTYKIV